MNQKKRPRTSGGPIRKIAGVLVGLAGTALGAYVGLYLLFVGGMSQLVDAVQEDPVKGSDVAWGVVKVTGATIVGVGIATIALFMAAFLYEEGQIRSKRKRSLERFNRR
jgi:hypothetical protein